MRTMSCNKPDHDGWDDRVEELERERDNHQEWRDRYRDQLGVTGRKLTEAMRERDRLREALRDLHAEVEMAESVGICLPDRTSALRAGDLLRTEER